MDNQLRRLIRLLIEIIQSPPPAPVLPPPDPLEAVCPNRREAPR